MSHGIEVATRPMTPEEAVRILKKMKLAEKTEIGFVQAAGATIPHGDELIIEHRLKHAALHMAIEALEKA